MVIVVAYDVGDDRRRARVARVLQNYGSRVQLSVFECDVPASRAAVMRRSVDAVLDRKADRVAYYPLCAVCRQRAERVPRGPYIERGTTRVV